MKPLLQSSARTLLERFDGARDSELRKIIMMTPTSFKIELSLQDANRGFDWINVAFEINGVEDARLLNDSQLSMAEMSEGISIVFEAGKVGFANAQCESLQKVKESQFYVVGLSIKYEELPFE